MNHVVIVIRPPRVITVSKFAGTSQVAGRRAPFRRSFATPARDEHGQKTSVRSIASLTLHCFECLIPDLCTEQTEEVSSFIGTTVGGHTATDDFIEERPPGKARLQGVPDPDPTLTDLRFDPNSKERRTRFGSTFDRVRENWGELTEELQEGRERRFMVEEPSTIPAETPNPNAKLP